MHQDLNHNYQVHNCNMERHEEWTQTSRVEDIIYHFGPDGSVRMHELDTYENYLGGRRYLDLMDPDGLQMIVINFD